MRLFVISSLFVFVSWAHSQPQDENKDTQTLRPQALNHRARRGPNGALVRGEKTTNVPPSTPVVTLTGLCRERQPRTVCQTVITRDDLDRFGAAFSNNRSETRGRLAIRYARMLVFSTLAEQQGLEKNHVLYKEPTAQHKFERMRALTSALVQDIQRKTISISESEIQRYYEEHRNEYEEAQVLRLAVPLFVPTESGLPLKASMIRPEMEQLHERAIHGGDLNELQHQIYETLRIQATPPPLNPITLRRSDLQGDEAKIFDLKPGEISSVLELAAAFAVIKLESKEQKNIADVHGEIENTLRAARLQADIRSRTKGIRAQFNLQYLGISTQPDIFGPSVLNLLAGTGQTSRVDGSANTPRSEAFSN